MIRAEAAADANDLMGAAGFVKQLRDAAFLESRFDRLWEILSQETHHIVTAFRKGKK